MSEQRRIQAVELIGLFVIELRDLVARCTKKESWVAPSSYFFEERGGECPYFKKAAKCFNSEDQEEIVKLIESLYKMSQNLPKKGFFKEDGDQAINLLSE